MGSLCEQFRLMPGDMGKACQRMKGVDLGEAGVPRDRRRHVARAHVEKRDGRPHRPATLIDQNLRAGHAANRNRCDRSKCRGVRLRDRSRRRQKALPPR
jgi:hypothetical protein